MRVSASKKAITTAQAALVLVIVSILISAGTLFYAVSITGQLAALAEAPPPPELTEGLAELAATEAELGRTVGDVGKTVGGLAKTIGELTGTVGDLAEAVGLYAERVEALEGTIKALEEASAALEERSAALEERIAGVEEALKPPPPAKEILVGGSLSLTGKYAESGKWYIQAYKLWEKDVNAKGGLLGRPVRVILYDDRSDPTTGVSNYERLITVDKVDLAIGPYASAIVFATSSVAEKYEYLFMEGGGTSLSIFTRGYKYVFLAMPGIAQDYSRGFFEFLEDLPSEKKPKTFAFMCEDTLFPVSTSVGGMAYAIGGLENYDKALEWLGAVEEVTLEKASEVAKRVEEELGYRSPYEVVFFEKYAKGTTDVTPIVSKVKALEADVLYVGGYFPDSVMGVRACKELDYNPMGIFATVGPSMPDFGESLGKDAMYVWCGVHFHSISPWAVEFVKRYEGEWGRKPDYHAAAAYAALQITEAAVEATGGLDNKKIRDWVATHNSPEKAIMTVTGPLYWDERGLPGYGMTTIQWQDVPGMRGLADYVMTPLDARETEPVWPMPPWAER